MSQTNIVSFVLTPELVARIFEGDVISFNSKINHSYSLLKRFIWLFNPKYAIIEVDLDNPTPMIISAPNVQFEMLSSSIIINDEIEKEDT